MNDVLKVREIGRSERIRTSDPLLPKQVRYQTALRSDRGGGVKPSRRVLQGGEAAISLPRVPTYRRFRICEMRGNSAVSARVRDSSTGRFSDTAGVPSRSTM